MVTKSQTPKRAPVKEAKVLKAAETKPAKDSDAKRSRVGGFIDFIREQGVVGLAVGLAIGTAAGAAVKQIVDGFINPLVGFAIGGIDLVKLKWIIVEPGKNGTGGLAISWGAILSACITLVATALVIYFLIHLAKLDRLDKKKDA